MWHGLILISTHFIIFATGFVGEIYTLPILKALRVPDIAGL